MKNKLYVIGIGPGDPELLTLKAVRVIKESPVLCVPKGREEGSSLALSIAQKAVRLDGKEIIEAHFPMVKTRAQNLPTGQAGTEHRAQTEAKEVLDDKWGEIAETILRSLKQGSDVAFLTLGDPTIYSTFFYLYDKLLELQPGLDIEIIPGVSSINASAARANFSLGLGNESIAILPANYLDNLKDTLDQFDTVVLMKVNKVLDEIVKLLREMELISRAVCVSRAGMEDEKIYRDITKIKQEGLNYFSMVIVRK
ncbi:MAG: precorrin-2 C(20)-methyltransferase [Nitrospiraceae bacterium]|nr:MAG: precorrin-2 C(20)-methyltransferase [Nitrospiraceae bacterium]